MIWYNIPVKESSVCLVCVRLSVFSDCCKRLQTGNKEPQWNEQRAGDAGTDHQCRRFTSENGGSGDSQNWGGGTAIREGKHS